MTLEVFFTADDFGLDDEVNEAVIRCHRDGALHGASLMMGQQGTESAVRLARGHPRLRIGWHLHLCDSKPVTCESWPWGRSPARAGFAIGLTPGGYRLMRREVEAQWELFAATGLCCDFVNAHHHLHVHPMVYSALERVLPSSFEGWIRLASARFFGGARGFSAAGFFGRLQRQRARRAGRRLSDGLWGIDRIFRMDAREIGEAVETLGDSDGLQEFMFHPRRPHGDAEVDALIELKTLFSRENGCAV